MDFLQYEEDIYLFNHGKSYKSYYLLGAHPMKYGNSEGIRFAVWAPNATEVEVIGDFNDWNGKLHQLTPIKTTGVWMGFFENIPIGTPYKYKIIVNENILYKADPYAFAAEKRPMTASLIHGLTDFTWEDIDWMNMRRQSLPYKKPINIYEVHAGSWKQDNGEPLDFYAIADQIIPYVKEMGYTHIELMPIMEHPFDGSWGYQQTGYYAPTSRYGSPSALKYFINQCHKNHIGVLLDWVPGHFCKDAHGLHLFDGTWLFGKYAHPQWGTVNFDFSKKEVISFLLSNAYYWLEEFHVDGLRVDGVTSMIYLNYGYTDPSTAPRNEDNNYINTHAIDFLHILNEVIFLDFPGILMIAEESTSWPLVTGTTDSGGLGFNYKWDMGWMNDTLEYMKTPPKYRNEKNQLITFSMHYAYSENFICSLSHDEVVHGKMSLINKMPGSYEDKFANLRLLLCYMMFHPGKKLLFMGCEFAQFIEWRYTESLEWQLLDYPMHKDFQDFVKKLNHFYLDHCALWQVDHNWDGFEWINVGDKGDSCFSFLRKGDGNGEGDLFICFNFSTDEYSSYELPLIEGYRPQLVFSTDKLLGDCCFSMDEEVIQIELKALSCYCFQLNKESSYADKNKHKEVLRHDSQQRRIETTVSRSLLKGSG